MRTFEGKMRIKEVVVARVKDERDVVLRHIDGQLVHELGNPKS